MRLTLSIRPAIAPLRPAVPVSIPTGKPETRDLGVEIAGWMLIFT
jgi:hypothetical protein